MIFIGFTKRYECSWNNGQTRASQFTPAKMAHTGKNCQKSTCKLYLGHMCNVGRWALRRPWLAFRPVAERTLIQPKTLNTTLKLEGKDWWRNKHSKFYSMTSLLSWILLDDVINPQKANTAIFRPGYFTRYLCSQTLHFITRTATKSSE